MSFVWQIFPQPLGLIMNVDVKTYGTAISTPPKPNVKITLGDFYISINTYSKNIPNRFQRWMLKKVFDIKVEKLA